jgi:branched-chain amino acid transport system ATP-binding protein
MATATAIPSRHGVAKVLAIEGISKRFGGLSALNDVSMYVGKGEIVGLIGPNGSGKTTLINVVTGGYGPSTGQVVFGRAVISGKAAHLISNAGVSRTFQKIRLFRNLTVFENVAVALYPDRVPAWLSGLWTGRVLGRSSTMHERTSELLAVVGLRARCDDLTRNLSYGEQRMLEIARALATRPQLILLDEPAAGLSAVDVELLRGVIARIKQNDIAIVLVDHHTTFLMSVVDRLVVLNQGRVIFDGIPTAARRDRGVIDAYLGAAAHA